MAFTNLGVGPPPRKKSAPPPPFGGPKKPDLAVMIAAGPKKPEPPPPAPDGEAAEPPAIEGQEEYGARLMQDIEDAGASVGIHDPAKARAAASAFLGAIAKCLSEGGAAPEPPMDVNESDTENYPA